MSSDDSNYLNLLGHCIGLSALDPEVWTCSCGVKGSVSEMADHIQSTMAGQIQDAMAGAKAAGLLPLKEA